MGEEANNKYYKTLNDVLGQANSIIIPEYDSMFPYHDSLPDILNTVKSWGG